jgi:predicted MFS family arabinose efflux permease
MPDVPPHISTVLSALRFRDPQWHNLGTLTVLEWRDLLSRWKIQRLMIPLRKRFEEELPKWVRTEIDQNISDNAERFERVKAVYSEFAGAVSGTGSDHLVVKGFAQYPEFVEHPRFRLQSDIDIYCPEESIPHAISTLSKLGYQPERGMEAGVPDHLPAMVRETSWKWRENHYDPEMPVSFELHFCFWNEEFSKLRPMGLDQFWRRRAIKQVDGFSFPALAPIDNLAHSALVVLRDSLRGQVATHQLYELAAFLHKNAHDTELWQQWRELHDDSLRRLQVTSFRLASQSFDCDLSEDVKREIHDLPFAVHSWFDQYGESLLAGVSRPNKKALWLHLSLLESASDKAAILFRGLFPARIPPLEAPYIQNTADGQPKKSGEIRKRARHGAYVVVRAVHHARFLPALLWQGVRWWVSTKGLNKQFWTFFAASFLFDLGMYIFFLLYNLYLLDRGFPEKFLGLIASASALGSIAGTIPAGILAQRFGLRKALLVCMISTPLLFALRALLSGQAMLLAMAFLGGFAVTIWAVCISPAISQVTNERSRPFGFSIIFSSGIAIGILGGQIGGRLPGWLTHLRVLSVATHPKQAALLVACILVGLAALPIFRLTLPSAHVGEKKFYPRNPFLLRFLPAIALWGLAIGAFDPFFNVYFSQYLHMPVKQIGAVYSDAHIAEVLAILASPFIFRKFGLVTGIMYTQIAAAISLGCLAVTPGATVAALVYAGYSAFQWMSEPGMFSLLMSRVADSERAGASALNFLVISSSQALAAAVAGASFGRFGYPTVLAVIALVALGAAVVFRSTLDHRPIPKLLQSATNS